MFTIKPDTSVLLDHRAFHVAASSGGSRVVALTPGGRGSFIDKGRIFAFKVPEKPNQIALDASGQFLAVTSDRGLLLLDTATSAVLAREAGAFQGCLFSGTHLWVTRASTKQEATLELRDTHTLQVDGQQTIADPFGDSFFMLFSHPGPAAVSVWAAAGQDGRCLFWACAHAGELSVIPFPELAEVSPPDFALTGASFLVIVDKTEVRHYSYPESRLLATITWPDDHEEDEIGDSAFFVGPEHAIVESNEGRMYMLDLRRAALAEEVAVAGHTPRPVADLYPTLASETGLCTDLAFVVNTGGGRFLSVHRRLPSKIDEWHDEVAFWCVGITNEGTGTASLDQGFHG